MLPLGRRHPTIFIICARMKKFITYFLMKTFLILVTVKGKLRISHFDLSGSFSVEIKVSVIDYIVTTIF